jgi:hypothetical protein
LNGTYKFYTFYADNKISVLGKTIIEITEALLVAFRDLGLEVNAGKNKYIFVCSLQNTGRKLKIKIDKRSFENIVKFKYFGEILNKI